MKELKNIFPTNAKVVFGEDVVDIKGITLKQMPVIAKISEKLFDKAFNIILSGRSDQEIGIDLIRELIQVLKNDTPLLVELLASTTSVTEDVLQAVSLEALLFLLDEVIEVNQSFLSQNVLPKALAFWKKYSPQKEKK